ncbi:hypothetical protein BSKO_08113 [Bryopsis sp. KO-2023]|nr:hypothetical protein BSKO_08113 [Bryopsis sp. KO-2023]
MLTENHENRGETTKRMGELMSGDDFASGKTQRQDISEDPQAELESLFEQLRQKDAQILVGQKKLNHFRSWMNSLQAKVNAQNPQAVKNARRLYIGGFPQGSAEEDLRQFLSNLMKQTGGCVQVGNPVLSVKVMKDKNYAFAEFRTVEEAANATAFDGVAYKDSYLKIKRPSNYDVNSAMLLGPVAPDPTMDTSGLDICRSTVEDSPNKLFIGGLPYDHSEEQVREIMAAFGPLKSFNLVMDRNTGKSKGYAFCELLDGSLTDHVIQQLNARKAGNKSLTVKRASEGSKSSSPLLSSMLGGSSGPPLPPFSQQPKGSPNYGMAAMSTFGFGNSGGGQSHGVGSGGNGFMSPAGQPGMMSGGSNTMMPSSNGGVMSVSNGMLAPNSGVMSMSMSSGGRMHGQTGMMGGLGVQQPGLLGVHSNGMKEFMSQAPALSNSPMGMGLATLGSMAPTSASRVGAGQMSMMGLGSPTNGSKTNSMTHSPDPGSMVDFNHNMEMASGNGLSGLTGESGLTEMMGGVKMDDIGIGSYGRFGDGFDGLHGQGGGASMISGMRSSLGMGHNLATMW